MIKRILGTVVILLGALGIVLSVLGTLYVWRAADSAMASADDGLVLLSDTLENVERSLDVASTTLDGATVAVQGLYTTTLDVRQTLSSTQTTLDEMAGLTEDSLPRSVEASLTALKGLEETARVVDQLLRGLSAFGLGDYEPDIPLDEAVAAALDGLEPVPDSLRQMGRGLRQTSVSLEGVQSGMTLMGDQFLAIRDNTSSADAIISDQTDVVQGLRDQVHTLRQDVGRPIRAVAWGATLLLIWIGLSQLALIQWGVSLWQRPIAQRAREPEPVPSDSEGAE